jgi:hypothetical protein
MGGGGCSQSDPSPLLSSFSPALTVPLSPHTPRTGKDLAKMKNDEGDVVDLYIPRKW